MSEPSENINIILTQTTLTYEEASKKLEEYNNDYMKVLYEYHGIKPKDNSVKTGGSINQMIYKEIRTYMNGLEELRKPNKN